MDVTNIVFWVVVLALGYGIWVWWKDGRSLRPFCGRMLRWIRSTLGVASRDEVKHLHEQLKSMEQQWEARLTKVEATAKFSTQLESASKETDRRLGELERSKSLKPLSENRPVSRPRSVVRFGLRLTLGDALWGHLGMSPAEAIEDRVIDSALQGPFCPVCLKRVVGRNRTNLSECIPPHCRHCGVSWDSQEPVDLDISLVDLKRQVYVQLDQEYRANGIIQSEL